MLSLGYSLAEFSRTQWAPKAQPVWQGRFARVSAIWNKVERQSILYRIRPSCMLLLSGRDLLDAAEWARNNDCAIVSMETVHSQQGYSNASQPPKPGQPTLQRVVICGKNVAGFWHGAWEAGDQAQIGALLGFPSCCVDFFIEHWVREDRRDLTWYQAVNTTPAYSELDNGLIEVHGYPLNNVLLRQLGIRMVPHLPCSYRCIPTETLGLQMLELAEQLGYKEEADWVREILDWPMEWSALHGIAETVTPVCKVSNSTDATAHKHVIHFQGRRFPTEGERSKKFPFINKAPLIQMTRELDEHKDNGFNSRRAMDEAHKPILDCATFVPNLRRVQDLGCGNGKLLRKINGARNVEMFGVEIDRTRIDASGPINVRQQNIFDEDLELGWVDLNIMCVDRFFEVGELTAAMFLDRLRESAPYLISYTYSGEKYGHYELHLNGWKEIAFSSNGYCLAALLTREDYDANTGNGRGGS